MIVAPPGPALAVAVAARCRQRSLRRRLVPRACARRAGPPQGRSRRHRLGDGVRGHRCARAPRRTALVRTDPARRSVAVVGAGVSGLTAAYVLQRDYDVTLYEAEPRLGGHAHTHDVLTADERVLPIDSGFIVHNDRTYPYLLRLFDELGVETQATDMSMSVRCDGCGLEYAGARGFGGVFADVRNAREPAFLKMLVEVKRFHRRARMVLETPEPDPARDPHARRVPGGRPLLALFRPALHGARRVVRVVVPPTDRARLPGPFTVHVSRPPRRPGRQGLSSLAHGPGWVAHLRGTRGQGAHRDRALSTPVRRLARTASGVDIRDDDDETRSFDHAVVATHADQALALLARPTRAEHDVLGAFGYSVNETILHTDGSGLPRHHRARASWNYHLAGCSGDAAAVQVSYDMNRLHRLDEQRQYVVTLNGGAQIHDEDVIARMQYTHPVYTRESVGAAARLPELNDGTVAYAGAYHGWGFHEDGCASGVRGGSVARGDLVTSASLYRTRIRHGRVERIRHGFEYRHVMWLVDVDDLPVARRGLRGLGQLPRPRPLRRSRGQHPRQRRRVPGRARCRRPARPGPPPHEPALLRVHVQPALGVLVLRARRRAPGHHRRGAQHVRPTSLLLRAARCPGCGPGRQGVLRVTVLRRRRPLRHAPGANRARSSTSRSRCDAAPTRTLPSPPRCRVGGRRSPSGPSSAPRSDTRSAACA